MNIYNIASSNSIIVNRKIVQVLLRPSFFMLLTVKSFEMFPGNNGNDIISKIEMMDS